MGKMLGTLLVQIKRGRRTRAAAMAREAPVGKRQGERWRERERDRGKRRMERKTEERNATVLLVAGEVRLGRPRARGAGLAALVGGLLKAKTAGTGWLEAENEGMILDRGGSR